MPADENGEFEIFTRWKEEVHYQEDNRSFSFPAGWGVSPPVLYVPSIRLWEAVMPDWLRGRRTQVVGRLGKFSEHSLEDTDDWP